MPPPNIGKSLRTESKTAEPSKPDKLKKRVGGAVGKRGPGKLGNGIKEEIEAAFRALGGANWLYKLGQTDPGLVTGLLARVLPKQVELSGPDNSPLIVKIDSNV